MLRFIGAIERDNGFPAGGVMWEYLPPARITFPLVNEALPRGGEQ